MVPDIDLRDFLRRASGYSLTGDTSEEALFFAHGPGSAGKSTFGEALKAALGDYATTTDFETFLRRRGGGIRNDIARLAGARFVLSLEVEDGQQLATAVLKSLTGRDTITARFLHQEFFEFKPSFNVNFRLNDATRFRGIGGHEDRVRGRGDPSDHASFGRDRRLEADDRRERLSRMPEDRRSRPSSDSGVGGQPAFLSSRARSWAR